MFSKTSSEFLDFSTTTLLSLTAVCILRTLDWLLDGPNERVRVREEAVRVSTETELGWDLLILAYTFTHSVHVCALKDLQILPLPGKREQNINYPYVVISNPLD